MSGPRFGTQKAAVTWLTENLGMYWEENCEEGRYAACVPPADIKDEPVYAYAHTVLETITKLANLVEA